MCWARKWALLLSHVISNIHKYSLWEEQVILPQTDETANSGRATQWNIIHPLKRKEIHATMWIILENFMLRERSQIQKVIYCKIPFTWNILNRYIYALWRFTQHMRSLEFSQRLEAISWISGAFILQKSFLSGSLPWKFQLPKPLQTWVLLLSIHWYCSSFHGYSFRCCSSESASR